MAGQNRNEVLRDVFERACALHNTRAVECILDLDYESIPSVRPILANGIWPRAMEPSLVDDCACVLRCLLKNGLDPYQRLGEQGDGLMWAVRGADSYTVMHLLRMGCDLRGVRVRRFHTVL